MFLVLWSLMLNLLLFVHLLLRFAWVHYVCFITIVELSTLGVLYNNEILDSLSPWIGRMGRALSSQVYFYKALFYYGLIIGTKYEAIRLEMRKKNPVNTKVATFVCLLSCLQIYALKSSSLHYAVLRGASWFVSLSSRIHRHTLTHKYMHVFHIILHLFMYPTSSFEFPGFILLLHLFYDSLLLLLSRICSIWERIFSFPFFLDVH